MHGLVAVRVISITRDPHFPHPILVRSKVTAHKAQLYRHGEIVESTNLHTVPRRAVRRRDNQWRIGQYTAQIDGE
jgi:hypothetical protein